MNELPRVRRGWLPPFAGGARALCLLVKQCRDKQAAVSFQVGIDPTYADPRRRIYYCAIRHAFK